jgi:hypothetical protein
MLFDLLPTKNINVFLAAFILAAWTPMTSQGTKRPEKSDDRIVYLELDEHTVYRIPVSPFAVTTISFPSEIEGLEGRNIALSDAESPFFLSYTGGNYYFSVTANQPDVKTNLNVLWNYKTYVLELIAADAPALSVVFTLPKTHRREGQVSPPRLLGMLDIAKAFPLLRTNFPREFGSVEMVAPNRMSDFGKFTVTTDKIYRFNDEDTLVFDVTLTNNTDQEIVYEPQGFAVRVGNNVYYQSISDASGRIPPHGKQPGYFAVTGTPDGGRNDLSLANDFTVIVSELEPKAPQPQQKSPQPQPKPSVPAPQRQPHLAKQSEGKKVGP